MPPVRAGRFERDHQVEPTNALGCLTLTLALTLVLTLALTLALTHQVGPIDTLGLPYPNPNPNPDHLQQGGALGRREREVEEAHDAIHLRRQAAHEVLIVHLVRVGVRVKVSVRVSVRVGGARRWRNRRLWRRLPEAPCAATCCLGGGGAPLKCGAQPARASRSLG